MNNKLRDEINDAIDDHCVFIERAGFEVSFRSGGTSIAVFYDSSTDERFVLKLQRANTGREVK
jgi:hypothetical protein